MNTAVPTTKVFHHVNQAFCLEPKQSRLIIITDSVASAAHLQAAFSKEAIAITVMPLFATNKSDCWCDHDLAIVDVSPASLRNVLMKLRASQNCENISILVDVTRLTAEPALAGVLPAYRAMPCGGYELLRLARRLCSLKNEVRVPATQL